jgi:Fe-S cluster biogenesis protein NfuA
VNEPDTGALAVLAHFRSMLGADGTVLQLRKVEAGVLTVSYEIGDCDTCELAPEDLVGMMEEQLARRGSAIRKVALA